jgi:hypothetical protein
MAKFLILLLTVMLFLLMLSFSMFNDNPKPNVEVGSMSYMVRICEVGLFLCVGALYWLDKKDRRSKR